MTKKIQVNLRLYEEVLEELRVEAAKQKRNQYEKERDREVLLYQDAMKSHARCMGEWKELVSKYTDLCFDEKENDFIKNEIIYDKIKIYFGNPDITWKVKGEQLEKQLQVLSEKEKEIEEWIEKLKKSIQEKAGQYQQLSAEYKTRAEGLLYRTKKEAVKKAEALEKELHLVKVQTENNQKQYQEKNEEKQY